MSQSQAFASSSRDIIDSRVDLPDRFINAAKQENQCQLEVDDESEAINGNKDENVDDDEDEENCLICLGEIINQSVLPKCRHSLFCFDCIVKWISIHRRCPLCSTAIEGYIIHSIRSDVDYIRHYIPSLNTRSKDLNEGIIDPLRLQADLSQAEARRVRRQLQQRITRDESLSSSSSARRGIKPPLEWVQVKVEERQRDAIANRDQRLLFRSKVYRERLYCQHIGTNLKSKLSPPFNHSIISSCKSIESNLLNFIRRELLAYPLTIDVDFLSRYTIHVFKTFDCKSNESIDLMAEFLGIEGAQHFCHEVYSFSRFIGDGNAHSSSRGQRDKVKAFDAWARYNLHSDGNQKRVSNTTASLQEKEESSMVYKEKLAQPNSSSPTPTPTPTTVRQQVIRDRANLLQKLQEENKKKAFESSSSEKQTDLPNVAKDSSSIDREKALKAKLTLQKREAQLREQAKRIRT